MQNSNIPPSVGKHLNTLLRWVEVFLLLAITLATVAAIGEEFVLIYNKGLVSLSDILLMFIYLEILAMVHQYLNYGKLPVRYPIYIAIIAIARYIILGMKEMDGLSIIGLSVAIFILAAATLVIRVGHHYWPYNKLPES